MDKFQYNEKYEELSNKYESDIYALRSRYINDSALFNIGEYVYNITGIIKIDKIGFMMFFDSIEITYTGKRYKKIKGVLSRIKDNTDITLSEKYLKKL